MSYYEGTCKIFFPENMIEDCMEWCLKCLKIYLLNALAISCRLTNEILLLMKAEGTEFKELSKDIRFLIPFQVIFRSLIMV